MNIDPKRNDFSFTSRDYNSFRRELDTKFPDKPVWFKHLIAAQRDVDHAYLDAAGQDANLQTAFSPQAIYDHCARLDYYLSGEAPASAMLEVEIPGGVAPIIIPRSALVWDIQPADRSTVIRMEGIEDLVINTGTTAQIFIEEGRTVYDQIIGVSDGVTQWQRMILPDVRIIEGRIQVNINSLAWNIVPNLCDYGPTDRVCRLIRLPDGLQAIEFGDGEYGMIPPADAVYATYRVGGGVSGNFAALGAGVRYSGGDANIINSTLSSDSTGGAPAESFLRAVFLAPRMLKTKYAAVGEDDYERLAMKYSQSIGQVSCFPGYYGAGTIGVHIVPQTGGNFSSGFLLGLQSDLVQRSVLNRADVRVRNADYMPVDINIEVTPTTGASWSLVHNYTELALRLISSESTASVCEIYKDPGPDGGIRNAVTFINSLWGFSFTDANFGEVANILDRRIRDGVPTWGFTLTTGDIRAAVSAISIVRAVNLIDPTTSVQWTFNRMPTTGSLTITQG